MYSRKITVTPSDSSFTGNIKLRSLLDYFQDTASMAVQDIEGNTTEFLERGYAWVLTKYDISFAGSLPRIDTYFTVSTFHDPGHGYNTLRMFLTDCGINAKTSWLLVDVNSGRPVKPVSHLPEIMSRDVQSINPEFTNIPEFREDKVIRNIEFPVRFHDLDYNAHVNNAAYFEWVYDYSPVDFTKYELRNIAASFRSGARLGEFVTLQISRHQENSYVYRILRGGVNKPAAEFFCSWEA